MLLKRHYTASGMLDFIEVKHTGWSPEQRFSSRLVEAAQAEGWISLHAVGPLQLWLHARREILVYTVTALSPMSYACVLDAEQHARYQRPAGATVSHWRRKE